jgi:selenocysteine-specific elongation factor
MKGFGTVVTGTLISGAVCKEDELEVFPQAQRVRVRGVQVHGRSADQATAGQRTALNLAGATTEQLSRGMTLAAPGVFRATAALDVELSLLPSAKPLKEHARVHFHAYTSETIARVVLYGKKQIDPGETAFAQLRMAHSTLLLPGDRFIIRQFSPVVTIGGGLVLENAPPRKLQSNLAYVDFLEQLATPSHAAALRARIAGADTSGLTITDAVARAGWTPQQVIETAATMPEISRFGDYLILNTALNQVEKELVSTLDRFHARNPLVAGMSKEELRSSLPDVRQEVFSHAFEAAVRAGKLDIVGELVRLPGRGVVMKDEEYESKRIIEDAFASAGLKVPAMKDVLAGLKVDKARAQKIVTLLLRDKVLLKVSDDLLFHRDALADLRKRLVEEKVKSPRMDVARFKDLTGVTRKYAIPLLEYLDREHVTRRVGDERVIL